MPFGASQLFQGNQSLDKVMNVRGIVCLSINPPKKM